VYSFVYHIRRILPVIFLGMLILSMPSCKYLKKQLKMGEYSLKSVKEWAKQDSIWVADSLKRISVDKKVIEKPLPESVKRELSKKKTFEKTLTDSLMNIKDNNVPEENNDPGYYIITGSFTNHDNAVKSAAEYSAKGYTTSIINATRGDGTRVEHVSVKSFTDGAEARLFLNEFKAKYDPGAWIYSRK
jgi:hypothetical protein